ncbi:SCP2 sterol-binding domain-containing protein [Aliiglaciecola sp. 3_MG-2023]|uniref:ubiquinone biosynthesis accessory factor UbiJ n=1 Tax=Aliiglaciecola sp. 3_MG-2023 TaxID=3062644 RepID=UPI0026E226D2|nr:SCP2 sterol-binding domain-containing protein [Aliiglaciecola sp. 3_MG-2023]MDO6692336.1 SCP2 sterol-binding domain-containing protein [Aliiglaciecola sp. 3_MG-2023]
MPAAQLVSSGIERIINQLLKLDASSVLLLQKLSNKQLSVDIHELPWIFKFSFSDQVDVLTVMPDEELLSDCHLALSLSTLQKLKDTSQITRLIQNGELVLEGDVAIAQQFSQLITELDIDWEELLSKYTGDLLAHNTFRLGKKLIHSAKAKANRLATTLGDAAIEEKRIAAPAILVVDFCDQVNELRSATDRLSAKISRLESQSTLSPNKQSN